MILKLIQKRDLRYYGADDEVLDESEEFTVDRFNQITQFYLKNAKS